MLVLSRKVGEKLVIGNDIWVTVVAVKGNSVRVGIDAPDDVPILRSELTCCQDETVDRDQVDETPSSDEIVRLATASTREGAHLRRQALESEGIHCQTVSEYGCGLGVIPPRHAVPELWLYREDAERAKAILDAFEKHRPR